MLLRLPAYSLRASSDKVDTGLHAKGWSREQAIEYMVGTTGGAAFNLKDFHTAVLENGAVPLTVLERLVDEWIEGAAAAARSS